MKTTMTLLSTTMEKLKKELRTIVFGLVAGVIGGVGLAVAMAPHDAEAQSTTSCNCPAAGGHPSCGVTCSPPKYAVCVCDNKPSCNCL